MIHLCWVRLEGRRGDVGNEMEQSSFRWDLIKKIKININKNGSWSLGRMEERGLELQLEEHHIKWRVEGMKGKYPKQLHFETSKSSFERLLVRGEK